MPYAVCKATSRKMILLLASKLLTAHPQYISSVAELPAKEKGRPAGVPAGGWTRFDGTTGQGTAVLYDGSQLDGHFLNGKPDGYLIASYADGSLYEGNWRAGLRHGRGTQVETFQNGRSEYVGDWLTNRRWGVGILHYGDQVSYVGHWQNDLYHGVGTLQGTTHSHADSNNWFVVEVLKWIDKG